MVVKPCPLCESHQYYFKYIKLEILYRNHRQMNFCAVSFFMQNLNMKENLNYVYGASEMENMYLGRSYLGNTVYDFAVKSGMLMWIQYPVLWRLFLTPFLPDGGDGDSLQNIGTSR
jgi:hypothetical protein